MRISGIAVVVVGTIIAARTAGAEPQVVLVAGTSHGGDAQLAPPTASSCPACFAAGGEMPLPAPDVRLATLGVGVVGTEGRLRGGGELFTILGMGERTTGFAGALTYAGVDHGRVFTHAGLGIGSYWGDGRAGTLAAIAGVARAELGVRLHPQWLVVARGDYLLNDISASRIGTLALQWIP